MKRFLYAAATVVLVAGLFTGCKKSESDGANGVRNPFVGSWRISYGTYNITMEVTEKTWSIPGIGNGTYTYSGDYPDFVLTFDFGGTRFAMNAHFVDADTCRLCIEGECTTAFKVR